MTVALTSSAESKSDDRRSWTVILLVLSSTALFLSNLPASNVVAAFLACLVLYYCLRWPRFALYMAIFVSPYYLIFHTLVTSGNLGIVTKILPVDVLTLIAVLGMAIGRTKTKSCNWSSTSSLLCGAWLLISGFALARGLFMGYEPASRGARGALLFVLYFVALGEMNSPKRLRELRVLIIISSILQGVVGVAGATGLLMPIIQNPELAVGFVSEGITRSNFYGEPALEIPFIVFLLLTLTLKLEEDRLYIKLFTYIGILLGCATLMLSVTRGFWIGMAVAIITAFGLLTHYKLVSKRALVASVVTLVTALVLLESVGRMYGDFSLLEVFADRVTSATHGGDANVDIRVGEFAAYWDSFMGSPLVGNGHGSPVFSLTTEINSGFAHDEYVLILQTTGIVGFGVFAGFIISVIKAVGRRLRTPDPSKLARCFDLSIIATIVGFAAVAISNLAFNYPTETPFIATLLAVGSRQSYMRKCLQPARALSQPRIF